MSKLMKKGKMSLAVSLTISTLVWSLGLTAFTANVMAVGAGDLIKQEGSASVYYVGSDSKRYVFPNQAAFDSWYGAGTSVTTVASDVLLGFELGGNVVDRAGRLAQVVTNDSPWMVASNKVYAVSTNGTLQPIDSAATAVALFGSDWETRISPISEQLFSNYTVGTELTSSSMIPDGFLVKESGSTDTYLIEGGQKRMVSAEGFTANMYSDGDVVTASSLASYSDGSAVSGAESGLTEVAGGATTIVTPGVGTGLTVALASNTPAAATVPSEATGVAMLNINFTASSDGAATLDSLTLKKGDLGGASEVTDVYLYDGSTRLTNAKSVNSSSKEVNFLNLGISVAAGTTKTLTVKATLTGTGRHNLAVVSASSVTSSSTVSGSFPVTGNTMELTTAVTLGAVTVSKYSTLANVDIGSKAAVISKIKVTASNEDLKFSQIDITIKGTGGATEVSNLILKQGSTTLATVASPSGDLVSFTFDAINIKDGASVYLDVYADVAGKNAETITTYVDNDVDVVAIGDDYGYAAGVTRSTFDGTSGNLHTVTLSGGDLTIADNSFIATTYAPGNNDVVFLDTTWTATADMTIKNLGLVVTAVSGVDDTDTGDLVRGNGTEANLKDIKLINAATGAVISGPVELSIASGFNDAVQTLTFPDDWEIAAGESINIQVTADIDNNNPGVASDNDYTIGVDIDSTTVTFTVEDSNGTAVTDVVPSADITSNTMTVTTPVLTTAVSASPSSKTLVKGKTGEDVVAMVMSAVGDDITVTSIKLSGYIDADSGGVDGTFDKGADETTTTNYFKNVVTGVQLYQGSVSDSNKVGTKTTFNTTGEATISGISLEVPKDDSVKLIAVVDIATSAYLNSNSDQVYITILAPITDISAQDSEGTDVSANNAGGNVNNETVVTTVTNTGTLTASIGGSNPASNLITAGTSDVDMLQLTFAATDESAEIQEMEFNLTSGTTDEVSDLTLTYKNKNGQTVVKTKSVTTTIVKFTGLDIFVDKDNDADVMVSGDIATTVDGADSGAKPAVTFDFNTNFKAYGEDSGTLIAQAGSANIVGNTFEVYKTVLTVAGASDNPSGAGSRSSDDLVLSFNGTVSNTTNGKLGGSLEANDEAITNWAAVDADDTAAVTTATKIDGTNAIESVSGAATSSVLAYDFQASAGLNSYSKVSAWVWAQTSGGTAAVTFAIDDTAALASTQASTAVVTAGTTGTWVYVELDISGSADANTRYVGIKGASAGGTDTLTMRIDNVRFFNDSLTLTVAGNLNGTVANIQGLPFYLKNASGTTKATGYYNGSVTTGTVVMIPENNTDVIFGNSATKYQVKTNTSTLMLTDAGNLDNLNVSFSTGTQATAGTLLWNDSNISVLTPIEWVAGDDTIESAQDF